MKSTTLDGIDYGPLIGLLGNWKGERGVDIAPETDGSIEENPYYEEINFEAAGDVTNAGQQVLTIVRYHQKVYRKTNNKQFHDQIGYWLWDASEETIMYTLSIPRAVTLVAGGSFTMTNYNPDSVLLTVESAENGDWPIAESPFMHEKAKTTGFSLKLIVKGNKMTYAQTTALDIYGKAFDHTDKSSLEKI